MDNSKQGDIIAVHNHPNSSMPRAEDYIACFQNKYKYGVVACHDGDVHRYETTRELTDADKYIITQDINDFRDYGSDETEFKNKLEERYGILWVTLS